MYHARWMREAMVAATRNHPYPSKEGTRARDNKRTKARHFRLVESFKISVPLSPPWRGRGGCVWQLPLLTLSIEHGTQFSVPAEL